MCVCVYLRHRRLEPRRWTGRGGAPTSEMDQTSPVVARWGMGSGRGGHGGNGRHAIEHVGPGASRGEGEEGRWLNSGEKRPARRSDAGEEDDGRRQWRQQGGRQRSLAASSSSSGAVREEEENETGDGGGWKN